MATTDPQALRALAHPLRWQLLDVLDTEGPVTATRCAQVTGESVASCAYHLGILAKYGYVAQEEPRQGREKPWRLLRRHQELRPAGATGDGAVAAEAAADAFLDHEVSRFRARLRGGSLEDAEWRPWFSGMTVVMTAEELAEVRAAVMEVFARFAERDGRPEAYPAGGRPVRLFTAASVAPRAEGPGQGGGERSDLES